MGENHNHDCAGDGKCTCGHKHNHLYGQSNEVPAVFSHTLKIELKKEATGEELRDCFVNWVESLKQWALAEKFYIGHIKVFADNGAGFSLWLSTTGKEINVKGQATDETILEKQFTVNITAIVFGADVHALKQAAVSSLESSMS